MEYPDKAIPDEAIPVATDPMLRHMLDTYASETNKVVSTWRSFSDEDLDYRVHPKSSSVRDIFKHQLLSERRFFGEFLGAPEPPAADVLPGAATVEAFCRRLTELAVPRLRFLAGQQPSWWLEWVRFFDVDRERIWIFWRRVLHTAHHRTQLTVYLRLLDKPVPSTYGPTADVTWGGADPTTTVQAAQRK
jgi:uncharacterized damage-inducible protein DinB